MQQDLIYDVGMNNGDDSAYYLSKGYRVVAVEADPVLVEQATQRFSSEIAAGRITILNVAIAEAEDVRPFWISPTMRIWNSFDRNTAGREGREAIAIDVPCRRFCSILDEHGTPYYLKADIEGWDVCCIHDLKKEDLPRFASVEWVDVHSLLALSQAGYNSFKVVDQRRFEPVAYDPFALTPWQYLQRRCRDRKYLSKLLRLPGRVRRKLMPSPSARTSGPPKYAPDSSGPFGEEIGGPWLSMDEALFSMMAIELAYTDSGPKRLGNWFDIHATCSRAGGAC